MMMRIILLIGFKKMDIILWVVFRTVGEPEMTIQNQDFRMFMRKWICCLLGVWGDITLFPPFR